MVSQTLLSNLKKWLGDDGCKFFVSEWLKRGDFFHLHFGPGMQIRNWLRGQEETKNWDSIKLDNSWIDILVECLKLER
jgi:hypothetical protein